MAKWSSSTSASTVADVFPTAGLHVPSEANLSTGDLMWSTAPIKTLRTLYVYLCNGSIETISLCTSMELTDSEIIVRGRDGSAKRFPRADVYLASWKRVPPPVMF